MIAIVDYGVGNLESGETGPPVGTGSGQKEIPETVAKIKAGQ